VPVSLTVADMVTVVDTAKAAIADNELKLNFKKYI